MKNSARRKKSESRACWISALDFVTQSNVYVSLRFFCRASKLFLILDLQTCGYQGELLKHFENKPGSGPQNSKLSWFECYEQVTRLRVKSNFLVFNLDVLMLHFKPLGATAFLVEWLSSGQFEPCAADRGRVSAIGVGLVG